MGEITGCRIVSLVAKMIDGTLQIVVFHKTIAATTKLGSLQKTDNRAR